MLLHHPDEGDDATDGEESVPYCRSGRDAWRHRIGGAVDAERAGMLGQVQLPFPAPLDQFADRAGRESGGRDSGSAG